MASGPACLYVAIRDYAGAYDGRIRIRDTFSGARHRPGRRGRNYARHRPGRRGRVYARSALTGSARLSILESFSAELRQEGGADSGKGEHRREHRKEHTETTYGVDHRDQERSEHGGHAAHCRG